MKFGDVVLFYDRLESTTKRLEMGDVLVDLIRITPVEVVDKVLYLTQGKLAPDYSGIELGIAEKLLMKTISTLKAVPEADLKNKLVELGDMGLVAHHYFSLKTQSTLMDWGAPQEAGLLSVEEVHSELLKLSGKKAKDSQSQKMDILKRMLQKASAEEAKYIVRMVSGNMRLGIKDMSLLDAMAHLYSIEFDNVALCINQEITSLLLGLETDALPILKARELLDARMPTSITVLEEALKSVKRTAKADKPANLDEILSVISGLEERVPEGRSALKNTREVIENAYNLSSDIGIIVLRLKKEGMPALKSIKLTAGIPVRSMLAERLPSMEEIIKKMGGECALEYKYDGLRLQVHVTPDDVQLFSRGLENMTPQFPDVVDAVKKHFKGKDGIFDGECIPLDPNTGSVLPFQYISRRARRKYDLSTSSKSETIDDFQVKGFEDKIPVSLVLFDCLSLDGQDLTSVTYPERRNKLKDTFDFDGKEVDISHQSVVRDMDSANDFFSASVEAGCEGIIAKSLDKDSVYKAGKRGFIWIKYKRDYRMELGDSLDLAVVGAFHGHGRRTGVYGAFLMATFNPEAGQFETICKLGTGFDDATLQNIYTQLRPKILDEKPDILVENMTPDVYFKIDMVLEVKGAEITFSPVHTCAWSQIRPDFGLAVRFPRFTGRFRDDKKPEDATTTQEALSMFKNQVRMEK